MAIKYYFSIDMDDDYMFIADRESVEEYGPSAIYFRFFAMMHMQISQNLRHPYINVRPLKY